MNLLTKCIAGGLLLSSITHTPVASAGVPNQFTAGTTAKSSEVNQNFDYINYGNIIVKSNGIEVGALLGYAGTNPISILNSQGYMYRVNMYNATCSIVLEPMFFTTSDCTGTPYTDGTFLPGKVFAAADGNMYYIPKTISPIPITFNSSYGGFTPMVCGSGPGSRVVYPVTINDPSITGVSSTNLSLPITIERR